MAHAGTFAALPDRSVPCAFWLPARSAPHLAVHRSNLGDQIEAAGTEQNWASDKVVPAGEAGPVFQRPATAAANNIRVATAPARTFRASGERGSKSPVVRGGRLLEQQYRIAAPAAQIKDLLAKYKAVQKVKQAKLEAAQADLKAVLTVKQEAQATLLGLVN